MSRFALLCALSLSLVLTLTLRAADSPDGQAAPSAKPADVAGVVNDQAGKPAANVDVVLYYAQSEVGPEHGVVARAKTDAAGRFSMPGAFALGPNENAGQIPPRYTVIARQPNGGFGFKALPVNAAPADLIVDLAAPATGQVALTYADGKPAAGERVFLFAAMSTPSANSLNDILYCLDDIGILGGTTDANGVAEVPIPPGGARYYVVAKKDGYTRTAGVKKLALYPSATVTGKVTGADGKPVAGAVVRYACQNIGGILDTAVIADANGQYTIRDIATDGFEVQMDEKTTMKSSGGSVAATTTEGSSAAATFSVKPGETVTKDLQLAKGLELSGKVVDADTGEPLSGIELYAYANTGGSFRPNMLTTDAQGRFRTTFPSGAQVFINFQQSRDGSYLIDQEWQRTSQNAFQPFNERMSQSRSDLVLKLKLAKLQTLKVKVADDAGKPVAGAQVLVDPRIPPATTDGSGQVTVKAISPDGKHALVAKTASLGGIVIPKAGEMNVSIVAKPLVDRDCIATTSDGRPANKLCFNLYPMPAANSPLSAIALNAETDDEGKCDLIGLIAGMTYQINWQGEHERNRDYGDGSTTFSLATLKADEPIRFTANQYLNALMGKVVNTKGEPIADARFEVRSSNLARQSNELYNLKSNKDGTFEIQQLAPGMMEFAINAPGYRQRMFTTPTDNVDFVAVLRKPDEPADNEVIACDPKGKALADLEVILFTRTRDGQTEQRAVKTDANGKIPVGKFDSAAGAAVVCDDPGVGFGVMRLMNYGEEGQQRFIVRNIDEPWRIRIVDEAGKPISEATVKITSASLVGIGESNSFRHEQIPTFLPADTMQRFGLTQKTSAEGTVTFPRFSHRQYITVTIEAPGYGQQSKSPQPSEADTLADISLYHPATVTGKVTIKGVPDAKFDNCQVQLRSNNGRWSASVQFQPDGSFKMVVNEPGEYKASFYCHRRDSDLAKYRLPNPPSVKIEPGKAYTMAIELDEGIKIRGKLNAKFDLKAVRPQVAISERDGMGFTPVKVGEDGTFELTVSGPGSYKIMTDMGTPNSYRECPESITVTEQKSVDGVVLTPPQR